jgi:DNA-binding MarR family transcriptional regulator
MPQNRRDRGEPIHDLQQIQQYPLDSEQRVEVALHLPLSALLSQVLVAFTVEFDNEFEHQMPHRTAWGPATHSHQGPWLVSQVMWSNFMQYIGKDGVPLREIADLARITNLNGLERWGYIAVEPDPTDHRTKPPRSDWIVRPTPAGRRAQAVWRPLAGIIEERWQARFGKDDIRNLRESLERLVSEPTAQLSPLFKGLEPYPDGWRAAVPKPDTLPHYPMVLHRGGFPDGS